MLSSSQMDPAFIARCLAARARPALNRMDSCAVGEYSAREVRMCLFLVLVHAVVAAGRDFCCFGQGKLNKLWVPCFMGKSGVAVMAFGRLVYLDARVLLCVLVAYRWDFL